MYFFHRELKAHLIKGGGLISAVVASSIVGALVILIMRFDSMSVKIKKKNTLDASMMLHLQSAIETMVYSFRMQEMLYYYQVSQAGVSCAAPKSFFTALKEGSGCSSGAFEVFKNHVLPDMPQYYSYNGGCVINQSDSTCMGSEVLSIGENSNEQRIASTSYKFHLVSVDLKRKQAEFIISMTLYDRSKPVRHIKKAFSLNSMITNLAHLEVDGRVTQENPSAFDRCVDARPWRNIKVYDPSAGCREFKHLGSGTGLAFYEDRYLGFRPSDGQIIDLLFLFGSSYLVDENGEINGEQLFPAYTKSEFINIDDITVVGDSIYTVDGQGPNAAIGYYNKSTGLVERNVCLLGQLGWGQSYVGIAAHSSSDDVSPNPPSGLVANRVATFFLKTYGGDFLTAIVWTTNNSGSVNRECIVVKDPDLQKIEYTRTYGFDRTVDERPYHFY